MIALRPFGATPRAVVPDRRRVAAAFGAVLRAERERAGLSQEALADLANIHRTTPSLYERGLRQPTLLCLFTLAARLGTPPENLVAQTRVLLATCRDD